MSSCRHLRLLWLSMLVTLLLILCAVPMTIYTVEAHSTSSSAASSGSIDDASIINQAIQQLAQEYEQKLDRLVHEFEKKVDGKPIQNSQQEEKVPTTKGQHQQPQPQPQQQSQQKQEDVPGIPSARHGYHDFDRMYESPLLDHFYRSPLLSHSSSPFSSIFPSLRPSHHYSPFSPPVGYDLFDPLSDMFDLRQLLNEAEAIQQQIVQPMIVQQQKKQIQQDETQLQQQQQVEGEKETTATPPPQGTPQSVQMGDTVVSNTPTRSPLDSFFRSLLPSSLTSSSLFRSPLPLSLNVDVVESPDLYIIKADLAGIDKSNIKLQIQDNYLSIEAERKQEKTEESPVIKSIQEEIPNATATRYRRVERSYGKVVRKFMLPADASLDENRVSAKYENGVLTVEVPRVHKPETKQQRIDIK